MRPRPEGRGEPLAAAVHCARLGRRFNAATARRLWRTGRGSVPSSARRALQCGHSPKAVENLHNPESGRGRKGASMRPQPEGRGELQRLLGSGVQEPSFNAATARRPWRTPRNLGLVRPQFPRFNAATARRPWRTLDADASAEKILELQCGHSPKAVENRAKAIESNAVKMLQCGHSPKAVENRS